MTVIATEMPGALQMSARRQFALDVLKGLSRRPKQLPPKYFYDSRGSRLFCEITELPEYYLTDCELEILTQHAPEILAHVGRDPVRIVEFGSGDGLKTKIILEQFHDEQVNFDYLTVDISADAIAQMLERFREDPEREFNTTGVVSDYFGALTYLSENRRPSFALFLGSNIGNFSREEMSTFLFGMWEALGDGDHLLIGFDLQKSLDTLERAYNDRRAVTSAFNLNLLRRINDELGGEFDPDKFVHRGHYNPNKGAMESWLYATEEQDVYVGALKKSFHFDQWEGLQTEHSYKYTIPMINELAEDHGFVPETVFIDSNGYFADALWRVKKHKQNGRSS